MLENKQKYADDSTTGVPMLSLFFNARITRKCVKAHLLFFYFIIFDKFIYLKLAYIDIYKAFES